MFSNIKDIKNIILPVNYDTLHYTEIKIIREKYIEKQKGLCYYCKKPLKNEPDKNIKKLKINKNIFPDNFFKYPIHLHHDHHTSMTIGAVHAYCNAVLWQYEKE